MSKNHQTDAIGAFLERKRYERMRPIVPVPTPEDLRNTHARRRIEDIREQQAVKRAAEWW